MTITKEQIAAACAEGGLAWDCAKRSLEAAEKVAPLRAGGFEVTDELVCIAGDAYCNMAGDGLWESGALRAALEAASAELAKQSPQPARFTVTLEQAEKIYAREQYLCHERPAASPAEDMRDAINEVMGAPVEQAERERPTDSYDVIYQTAFAILRDDSPEAGKTPTMRASAIAQALRYRLRECGAFVNASPADLLRPNDRHGMVMGGQSSEPERVPGPFVSDEQIGKAWAEFSRITRDASHGNRKAFVAALRTLGPQPSEPVGDWTPEDEAAAASSIAAEVDDRDKLEEDDFRIARAALKAVRYRLRQPSEPEPARDVLTAEEREAFAALFGGWEDTLDISVPIARKALARIAPEPTPVSPLEALLTEMRSMDTDECVREYWAARLEAAIAAEKEQGR